MEAATNRFANLPPGNYTITVTAAGVPTSSAKWQLKWVTAQCGYCAGVGKTSTIVEVSGQLRKSM